VLFHHDSSAAPQTVQTASPVCGAKNFSSVRLYLAPQFALNNCRTSSPKYAPGIAHFPARNSAIIKLTRYPAVSIHSRFARTLGTHARRLKQRPDVIGPATCVYLDALRRG
jgi:hypothetical protein